MAKLNQIIKSVVSLLAILIFASLEVSCGGKGKGSDIILYKNNLLVRGNKGKGGTILIAGGHHGHHGGHHGGQHGGHHGGHHEGHHEGHKIIMMGGKGKGKGKGGYGMGGYGMGGKGKGKGGGMNWEEMIMGGGKY